MESSICLDPLYGDPYPLLKSCQDRDKQSVSRIDDSSIKYEQDNFPPMDKNLPKGKTSGKPGETNAPKMHVLDSSDIICHIFLMPNQENGQKSQVCTVKITKLAQNPVHTQFICSINDYQHE